MRQRNGIDFAKFLNRLRENPLSVEDYQYIRPRIIPRDSPMLPNAKYITLTNKLTDHYNRQWYNMSKGEKYILSADDIPHPNKLLSREEILKKIEMVAPDGVRNLQKHLYLAIGNEYDFVVNIHTTDGLTNGTPCIAKKYDPHAGKEGVIWVEPEDKSVGREWRNKHLHLYTDDIPISWIPHTSYRGGKRK